MAATLTSPSSPNPPSSIKLSGVLQKIIYRNDVNFYSVAEVKVNKAGDTVVVCGILPGVQCGETLEMTGDWVTTEKHGEQFNVTSFQSKLPSDVAGIRRYLGSGMIDGIGKIYAKKIVDYFGADTFAVLSTESARLLEIEGIGKMRAQKIKEAWDSQFAIRDIMIFLQTYGVTNALCMKLYEKYGAEARAILETDPYRVAQEVRGVGFKTADTIAQNIGIPITHPSRIDAGILHVFREAEEDGHTCLPKEIVLERCVRLLELSKDKIEDRIQNMLRFRRLCVMGENKLQMSFMREVEQTIETFLDQLVKEKSSSLPPIWTEKAMDWVQRRESLVFAPEQLHGLMAALDHKVSILTGGPGTGKTTILRALVTILLAKKVRVMLCAPTGRAAQRLSETTGRQAQTIHRMLQYRPHEHGFWHDEENPLEADYIIVDESSMIDTYLAAALFRAIPPQAHLLIVGDTDQLPSVGPGNVLGDLIHSRKFPVTRLSRIFRQESCSEIITTAYDIIHSNSKIPSTVTSIAQIDPAKDFHFIATESYDDCLNTILSLCKNYLPQWYHIDPLNDVQVLVPTHKGTVGTENINHQFQNTFVDRVYGVSWTHFRMGDKVMQSRNNYEKNIFNGDLGRISYLHTEDETANVVFGNDVVSLNKSGLNDLTLAYAISIHKSQGSEFPVVIIGLLKQHYIMLQRNLLYTAITRGKNKVFVVGDPAAYSIAVQNKERAQRMTGLYQK